MRHTFATRFALAGGSLPVLAKILGHADLSLLMRYVHPSQSDMDRAMDWYNAGKTDGPQLEKMLLTALTAGANSRGGPTTKWTTFWTESGPNTTNWP